MNAINISNFVNITIIRPPAGLGPFAVNNLALLTKETPVNAAAVTSGYAIYTSASDVATDWGTNSEVCAQAAAIFSQVPNIITGGGVLIVFPMTTGEVLVDAITRTSALQYYGGLLIGYDAPDAEILDAADTVQGMNTLMFVAKSALTATQSGALFDQIQQASLTKTRCLLYTVDNPRLFAAAYASRLMCVLFTGSNTTLNMHAKQLATITPDPLINETALAQCQAVGADVYTSTLGVPTVFTSGANDFADNVYNTNAFKLDLTVALFNCLATTSTKIPQTEPGMSVLTGAIRLVMEQYVRNAFIAPGQWNSPDTFGDPEDLTRNVAQTGYYIWHLPVNQQPQAERAKRTAPIIQAAVKLAGAINKVNLIVNINQ